METGQKKFLTTGEVARLFGVNPMTIYRKAKKGELPAIKFGKNWLFPEDKLSEWIAMRCGEKKVKDGASTAEQNVFAELKPLFLVYLFGSVATGHETPLSDIDIAYLDDGSVKPFDFEVELEDAVRKAFSDAPRIDLVRLNAAPAAVCYKAIKTGRLLYARSDEARAAFEEETVMRALDYAPVMSRYYREVA